MATTSKKKETDVTTPKTTSKKKANPVEKATTKKVATPVKKEAPKKATENLSIDEAVKAAKKKITQVQGPVIINKAKVPAKKKNDASNLSDVKTKPKKVKAQATEKTKEVKTTTKSKKVKLETKEEKLAYARLVDSFNYVANLTWVIEEKMLDTKLVPDLTLGELHVLEVVNNHNGSSTSTIANALKVTVGSLITCVNRLIQKEYLVRLRDDNDKRVINLSVTPKAKKVLKVHDKFHEDILLGVLEGVTVRDANKVMSQFVRVLENYINPKEKTNVITTTANKKPLKNKK